MNPMESLSSTRPSKPLRNPTRISSSTMESLPSSLSLFRAQNEERRSGFPSQQQHHDCTNPCSDEKSQCKNRTRKSTDGCDGERRRTRPSFFAQQTSRGMLVLWLFATTVAILFCDGSVRTARAFQFLPSPRRPLASTRSTPGAAFITTRQPSQSTHYASAHWKRSTTRKDIHLLMSASSAPLEEGDGAPTAATTTTPTPSPSFHWTSQTLSLALPALIGMLVDPLLSMMDTAYVGRLGSSLQLAALGACTSIFHLAFNAFRATTAATTSLVGNASTAEEKREIVQISLSLGLVLGLGVGCTLRTFGPWCLACMGIDGPTSPLFGPGLDYLRTRSLAAPAVLGIVVAEGAFRGFGDTTIPLLASGTAALVNLLLDPLLMLPPLSRGVQGAAAATAASQVGALGVYLWFLRKRRMLPAATPKPSHRSSPNTMRVIRTILGANLAMVCKQGALLLAWAYATAKATRIGQAHVAAHQVALSCWLVFALLQDGVGVASQVLLTKVLSGDTESKPQGSKGLDPKPEETEPETVGTPPPNRNSHEMLVSLVRYMLKVSFLQGLMVTCAFLWMTPHLPGWFVADDLVVQGHLRNLLPHVAGQMLLVSLTLVIESLAVGGKQFRTLAVGTALSTVWSMSQIQGATTVVGIWSRGIVGLFAGRLVTACVGTWKVLRESHRASSHSQTQMP